MVTIKISSIDEHIDWLYFLIITNNYLVSDFVPISVFAGPGQKVEMFLLFTFRDTDNFFHKKNYVLTDELSTVY